MSSVLPSQEDALNDHVLEHDTVFSDRSTELTTFLLDGEPNLDRIERQDPSALAWSHGSFKSWNRRRRPAWFPRNHFKFSWAGPSFRLFLRFLKSLSIFVFGAIATL
jgi:hypothetical protein